MDTTAAAPCSRPSSRLPVAGSSPSANQMQSLSWARKAQQQPVSTALQRQMPRQQWRQQKQMAWGEGKWMACQASARAAVQPAALQMQR